MFCDSVRRVCITGGIYVVIRTCSLYSVKSQICSNTALNGMFYSEGKFRGTNSP